MGMIFISHSSRNNAEAIGVRDWLVSNGWGPAQIFLDLDALGGGERWRQRLDEIGNNCEAVIVCLSDDWIRSPECAREFTHAESRGKPIFPIIVAPLTVKIPSFVSDIQFVNISDPTLAEGGFEKLKLGLKRAQIGPNHFGWPPPSDPARPPYRGLRSFEEDDVAIFFGRDAQITAGLDALRQIRGGDPHRILTIAAASGAGKSSFLKAGLLARLRRDEENFLILPTWRPGRDALGGETGLLKSLGLETPGRVEPALAAMQAAVIQRMQTFGVPGAGERPPPSLVLPLDQAEELFSAENSSALAAIDLLVQALAEKPDLLFIATIRSDSLGGLQADARVAGQLNLFNLPALPPSAFKEVIEGPAALAKPPLRIKPALTERLIADLDRADALPLLAFTLERLVAEYGSDGLLDLQEYQTGLGGVSGAINAAVEAAMRRAENDPALPNTRHDLDTLARVAFIPWLVQLDEADASPRRRVARLSEIPENSRLLILHFVEERLLVASSASDETVVEVSHEAVLRHWRGVAAWISEERIVLERLHRIQRAARDWMSDIRMTQRHDMLVHRGERLKLAEELIARRDLEQILGAEGSSYLVACRKAEDELAAKEIAQAQREKRQRRRTAIWQSAFGVFLVVAFAGVVTASWFLVQGERILQRGYSAILLDESRNALAEGNSGQALRLAVLGSRNSALSPRADGFDVQLDAASQAARWIVSLEGHKRRINTASFSPDGTRIVTASNDGTARVWSMNEFGAWQSEELQGHTSRVNSAAFSPDSTRIVTASADGTIRIWESDELGGWSSRVLDAGEGSVLSAEFSPDGSKVLALTTDGSTELHANSDFPEFVETSERGSFFVSEEFSVTTVRVWREVSDGSWESNPLQWHQGTIHSVQFSPDSTSLLTASSDGYAAIWTERSDGGWNPTPLSGHGSAVFSARFSEDGRRIITASADRTARVWTALENGAWQEDILRGHGGEVTFATFAFGSNTALTMSLDGLVRVWYDMTAMDAGWVGFNLENVDVDFEFERGAAVFSPEGSKLLFKLPNGLAKLGSTALSAELRRTQDSRMEVLAVDWTSEVIDHPSGIARFSSSAFSPDGHWMVTTSNTRTAQVWRVGSPPGAATDESTRLDASKDLGPLVVVAPCSDTMKHAVDSDNHGRTPIRQLIEADFKTTPLLNSLGYKVGEDVCESSKPKGLDAFLTGVLPRQWWNDVHSGE
ncbi:TIR domain-containing protein [Hyphomonas sp.]|uniref:nSTAND1 domain-containing NTPase n=1 Tax=Hyphomonas sp. TaxID=87 RepID=UPI001BCB8562|nr:TIR domain-containing protein [Hyphomonas sp.]